MEQITSFTVDHTKLMPGLYLSRQDGDITTYDLRLCRPNSGVLLSAIELHSIEHLMATFLRNSPQSPHVIYFGPMGCQTGFYLLVRDLPPKKAIELLQATIAEVLGYTGPMPGDSPKECGNYRSLNLKKAQKVLANYAQLIANWTPDQLVY